MNNQNNKNFSVKKLTVSAIFIALISLLTSFSFAIPGGHGYIHLGDSMIYTCAWALGGPIAGIVSALGSALTDVMLGYTQYVPATLIIKFLMGYVAYLIMKAFKYRYFADILAMIVSSIIMVAGYTFFEYLLDKAGAVAVIVPNLIQAVGGVVTGAAVILLLDNISAFSPYILWKANKEDERN
ncbi:MAG: ECF transporter S component [Eubacteriales bacterium]